MHPPQVALVTGGSRGIGRGICLALAEKGYSIAINYARNREAAEETQRMIGDKVETHLCQADIAQSEERSNMVDDLLARWNRIDVLVNNAGITSVGRKDILQATEESWDRVFGVNLKGPYFLTQRVAQEMIRRRQQLSNPCIINISSLSAYSASTNRGDYCISKAAMAMMTQLFAVRLAEHGIRVFEVRPGVVDTEMTAEVHEKYTKLIAEGLTPIRRWGTAADVGKAVAVLAGDQLAFSTGDIINVDGGFHVRRFPP